MVMLAIRSGRTVSRRRNPGELAKLSGKVRLIRIAGGERHLSKPATVTLASSQASERARETLHTIEVLRREPHGRVKQVDEMPWAVTGAPLDLINASADRLGPQCVGNGGMNQQRPANPRDQFGFQSVTNSHRLVQRRQSFMQFESAITPQLRDRDVTIAQLIQ